MQLLQGRVWPLFLILERLCGFQVFLFTWGPF